MRAQQYSNGVLSSVEFNRIDELQRNLYFQDASDILDSHVDGAILSNDVWFLNAYYQFQLYAMLPGYTAALSSFLERSIEQATSKEFLTEALGLNARLQNALGNSDLVISTTSHLLSIDPSRYDALYLHVMNGAEVDKLPLYKKQWRNRNKGGQYSALGFTLYEIKERMSDKATEKALLEANAYVNKIKQSLPVPSFSPIAGEDYITSENNGSIRPVFIMGLPRSGSTLVERQLSRFSKVRSLGECNFLKISAAYASVELFYGGEAKPGEKDCIKLRNAYQNLVKSRRYSEGVLIDKSLNNLSQLPFLNNIFPEFSAVICYRDPVKNALSIFRKYFEGDYRYAYSIDALCQHVAKVTTQIMEYKERFKDNGNVHFVDIDNYVSNQENEAGLVRNVLGDELTVDSNKAMDKRDDIILTASSRQARHTMSAKQMHENTLLSGVARSIGKCLGEYLL